MHLEWLFFFFSFVSVDEKFMQQSGVWSINQGTKKEFYWMKRIQSKKNSTQSVLTSECLNEFSDNSENQEIVKWQLEQKFISNWKPSQLKVRQNPILIRFVW